MNYTFVVLGVILVVVLYILYKVFTEKKTELATYRKLGGTVSFSDLKNPGSGSYYISIWLYVPNKLAADTKIYEINRGLTLTLKNDNSLTVSKGGVSSEPFTITDSFPLQRWTCVIVSVGGGVIDAYLDGKMVKSVKDVPSNPSASSTLTEGALGNGDIIYIAKFERIPKVIDAQTAYEIYMAGNGGNGLVQFLKRFGISLTLTKDSTDQSTLSFPP